MGPARADGRGTRIALHPRARSRHQVASAGRVSRGGSDADVHPPGRSEGQGAPRDVRGGSREHVLRPGGGGDRARAAHPWRRALIQLFSSSSGTGRAAPSAPASGLRPSPAKPAPPTSSSGTGSASTTCSSGRGSASPTGSAGGGEGGGGGPSMRPSSSAAMAASEPLRATSSQAKTAPNAIEAATRAGTEKKALCGSRRTFAEESAAATTPPATSATSRSKKANSIETRRQAESLRPRSEAARPKATLVLSPRAAERTSQRSASTSSRKCTVRPTQRTRANAATLATVGRTRQASAQARAARERTMRTRIPIAAAAAEVATTREKPRPASRKKFPGGGLRDSSASAARSGRAPDQNAVPSAQERSSAQPRAPAAQKLIACSAAMARKIPEERSPRVATM